MIETASHVRRVLGAAATRRQTLFALAALPASALAGGGLAGKTRAVGAPAAEDLDFEELYKDFGAMQLEFSAKVARLVGREVAVRGFMAPPLKAEAAFFVLTQSPMATCPFCETDASWPDNIIVVYLRRALALVPVDMVVLARGRLECGAWTDPDTGFASQLRLREASVAPV